MSEELRIPVIAAVGACTSAGGGLRGAFDALLNPRETLVRQELFDSPRYADRFFALARGFGGNSRRRTRCGEILFECLSDTLRNFDRKLLVSDRAAVFFGTSIGGIFESENAVAKFLDSGDARDLSALKFYECSTLADMVAKSLKTGGMACTYSTACSSSSVAFAAACNGVFEGAFDIALVCGADSLSRLTVNGFGSLLLLSSGECKPFDKFRDGINLGEAAAAALVCSREFAEKNGLEILAEVSGWSCTADAFHPTAPHPEGEGAARAFAAALKKSSLSKGDIDFVCAHGTATVGNDTAEFAAMKNFFGSEMPPYASNKRRFGHTLGASGILNIALCVESMRRGVLPPSAGFETLDAAISVPPLAAPKKFSPSNILTSSLGFGGNNSSAVISKKSALKTGPATPRKIRVHTAGVACEFGFTPEEVLKNFLAKTRTRVDFSNLLADISPLKKRKFADLQKLLLNAARDAAPSFEICKPETCVCVGTGLGMVCETQKFALNAITKREAEPMPTAFTNSVHNALSSAVAINLGYKGLNSASTARDLSFETALWTAVSEIRSGSSEYAMVCAADERNAYAEKFASLRGEPEGAFMDLAAAYMVGVHGESRAIAEVESVEIFSRASGARETAELILSKFSAVKIDPAKVSRWYVCGLKGFSDKFGRRVLDSLNAENFYDISAACGLCESASALGIILALAERKPALCASLTFASTGQAALTIFKTL